MWLYCWVMGWFVGLDLRPYHPAAHPLVIWAVLVGLGVGFGGFVPLGELLL